MVAPSRQDELLERDKEIGSLDRLIRGAVNGDGRLVLLEGAAGIGKTRLLGEARQRSAAAGLQTYVARGAEMERESPFGIVRQLFEAAVLGNRSLLSGTAAAARAVFDSIAPDAIDRAADSSFAVLHGLYWLTANAASAAPLLIVVDDLQWCDSASLRFLAYLSRRLEGLPVLVVCGSRQLQTHTDVALASEIGADPRTVSIHPRPLSELATERLISVRLGAKVASAFCSACHEATGGNPLLLHELLRALAAEGVTPSAANQQVVADIGPRAVSRAVFLRMAKLPRDAVRIAHALAVLGDGAGSDLLGSLTELTETRVTECLSLLAQTEIVQSQLPTQFVHPLVGSAVYSDIPPAQRAVLHERAATLLSALEVSAEQVAAHLLTVVGRGRPWVVATLRRAARSALAKGAPDSAVAFLGRALAEPPTDVERPDVLLELGQAEALISGPDAVEHLTEAHRLLTDPVSRADAAQSLARALLFTGHPEEGAKVARAAAAEALTPELADVRSALEAFEYLAVLFGAGDTESLNLLSEYRTRPVGSSVGAKMLAAIAGQHWIYECGPSSSCAELSLAALAGGDLIAADNGLLATVAITNLVFADRPEAMDWWEVARADAYRRGSLFAASAMSLWLGHSLYYRGELADAEESLRSALDQFQLWRYGREQAQIYCDAFLSAVLRERGRLADARAALTNSFDTGGRDDGCRYWLNSRVELLLAERRYDQALAAVLDYERRFAEAVRNPMDAPWRSHKAIALHALGHDAQARELVEEELALARQWGGPSTIARSLRTLAHLDARRELALLDEAATVLDGCPARLERAKTLVMQGSALRRARRIPEARDRLRAGFNLAQACGAGGLAVQARTELYASGGRPRSTTSTGVDSLSASERRVAELASEGVLNRNIAQTLFVTPKTVEAHLSNAYRKLGIRSRHELRATLGR